MIAIRPVNLPTDRAALLALDCSFVTERVYRVARSTDSFSLIEERVSSPLRKVFPLADDLGTARTWEAGFGTEEGEALVGFIAFNHRAWNRRTEIAHCYVAPAAPGRGVGRALLAATTAAAREGGTHCLWLETSTSAHPAIGFYRHLGFTLCGLDLTLYDPSGPTEGEAALYFVRPLAAPTSPSRANSP